MRPCRCCRSDEMYRPDSGENKLKHKLIKMTVLVSVTIAAILDARLPPEMTMVELAAGTPWLRVQQLERLEGSKNRA